MNQQSQSLSPARSRKCAVYRMVLAAMFACLAFVLNTFVYFPAMAPFQHFVDVIAAVTLGPWYACAAAFICGILRPYGSGCHRGRLWSHSGRTALPEIPQSLGRCPG